MKKIGQLTYIINHTLKEWFCPDVSKWGEVLLNKFIMIGILEILKCRWNNCKIEILGGYDKKMDDIFKKYKEINIDFDDFR